MEIERSRVYEVLRTAATVTEASETLGMSIDDLRALANKLHMPMAYQKLERGSRRRRPHSSLVDMTGNVLFGGALKVIKRAANSLHGNACWQVKFSVCGHQDVYQGIELRSQRVAPKCRVCRDKQPKAPRRRAERR